MNKENSLEFLYNTFCEMISANPLKKSKDDYSIAKLFGRPDLTQSQKIQLGTRMEEWINSIVENHKSITSIKGKNSKLWVNIYTNEVSCNGNGKGLKDIDILFKFGKTTYYFESKNNLNLDTEKGPATIEKVKTITECLINNENFSNVVGKVISIFWDEIDVPISGSMRYYNKSGRIMWFGEFCELLNLDITKSDYEDMCKKFGKLI